LPAGKSIAVLPFVDLSPEKDNEYFSDGMTEELINALAGVEGLHVASRTSAFAFKGNRSTCGTSPGGSGSGPCSRAACGRPETGSA
jgi:TolB-like protein